MKKGIEDIVRYCERKIREEQLSYDDFLQACKLIRRQANIQRPQRARRLPRLLSEQELQTFFETAAKEDPKWELLFRVLLATACRVNELTGICVRDINFENFRILIRSGKGNKDRYVPFPVELSLPIRQQCQQSEEFLFESRSGKRMSDRHVQLRMSRVAVAAGLVDSDGGSLVHPHLFRHQTITFLLESQMPPQEVMRISGHSHYQSLEIYDHLALRIAHDRYQQIMAGKAA